MVKRVVVTIKAAKVTADFQGFEGKTCEDLEHRLRLEGTEVTEVELKPEHAFELQAASTQKVIY
ncbi:MULTISPECIES: hypothetical protein [unclassified Pseudomonas]|uniref:hypothetical protein n=1 Tax=unclassified Pseudomonas TaxID=196821 RepID=UPI00235FE031|nr:MULTISPECIES: hypothetical protein [unclassified Pseudomonas]